jgi:DNA-binding XRE family transcriptional regulator
LRRLNHLTKATRRYLPPVAFSIDLTISFEVADEQGWIVARVLEVVIRELRDERDLKQLDVAEDAGITVAHLSRIESGKVNPTWGTVEAIAGAIGVSLVDVAERTLGSE